ncbi:NAD(P)-binding protein [Acrodontium crateriforme]|uniref:NAD(P)-binding protein n=1 Tax=Acrodontium crateriforme TaxID=150365 RepID=A0AAQ3LWZ4_9PEZI|nr:NAD(P)-binding protein [Acrodontium crateriforme]
MPSAWMDAIWQCFRIPAPTFTDAQLQSQAGRVFIVTGGYAGCGKELTKMLYSKHGTIYIAGRSQDKADAAIKEIKALYPSSDGRLEFLFLDLADLPTIKKSADTFLAKEQRLDVLTNNAGVMTPPKGSKTAQSYELQLGTNVLGPYLFTSFLTPLLQKTAASSPAGSVRVTWAASLATMFSPKGGIAWDESGSPKLHGTPTVDYAQTKASNALLAMAYASRYSKDGIVTNAWNPGNLQSELQRHQSGIEKVVTKLLIYPTVFGGYTELFAGWSDEAGKPENAGKYIGPWGRFVILREDIKTNKDGATKLWEWCEKETATYK